MARLGIEPRPTGYIPGALPLSYLAWVHQSEVGILYGLPLFCHFNSWTDCTSNTPLRASILYPSFTLLSLFSPSFAHPQGHFFSTYNHNHSHACVYLISPVPTLIWYRGGVLEHGDHDTITCVHVTRNPANTPPQSGPFTTGIHKQGP